MSLTNVFGETRESLLGNAFGAAASFVSDKVEIGPSAGAGRGLNVAANTVANSFDFGALQV